MYPGLNKRDICNVHVTGHVAIRTPQMSLFSAVVQITIIVFKRCLRGARSSI